MPLTSESPGARSYPIFPGDGIFAPFLTLSLFVFVKLFPAWSALCGALWLSATPRGGKGTVDLTLKLLLYILAATVNGCLLILEIAMFLRAILSWFLADEDSALMNFLHAVTEPFIYPVRKIFEKGHIAEGIPIDIPFLVTFLIITILRMII